MVPKQSANNTDNYPSFRAVLFRMVPKPKEWTILMRICFRAVLFRMVPKLDRTFESMVRSFRAVLFRMVPKHQGC
ncbi:MAG: hypothetical protein ACTIJE_05430, partial [Streptococcus thermophilus]